VDRAKKPYYEIISNKLSPRAILGLLLLVLIGGGILAVSLDNSRSGEGTGEEASRILPEEPIASYSLLYGNWAGGRSQIFAYDLSSREEYVLGTLPINVKKVTLFSENQLLFINNTDGKDHGLEIAIYSMQDGNITPIYTADDGFGIDDYQISPNKRYIAVWEVQFSEDSNALSGGNSRVYTADTTLPNQKNLISSEPATAPVLYPLAITDTGEVFMDRFLPNSGAGWAYGMSTSDFLGNQVQELSNMREGTYGTQPQLSKDGRHLLFAGYNGQRGEGNNSARGYRRALLTPNTVELLDTITKERIRLPLSDQNVYSEVVWEEASGNIRLAVLSKDVNQTGNFIYNIDTQSLTSVTSTSDEVLIADLGNNIFIEGKKSDSTSLTGNLGEGYAQPYSDMTVNVDDRKYALPVSASLGQILGITSSSNINTRTLSTTDKEDDRNTRQLKLQTFEIKPSLEPQREEQQSRPIPQQREERANLPRCRDLAATQCNEIHNTNYSGEEAIQLRSTNKKNPGELTSEEKAYAKCVQTQWTQNQQERSCSDSPLYFYGPKGKKVSVQIHTPIQNENIPENNGKYSFTLQEGGKFTFNGTTYSSLSFDYTPAVFTKPPIYGKVVKKESLESVIKEYAQKLGLNEKETSDLFVDVTTKAYKDYLFISFFDQNTSKYILPISFNPKPDTYINYVFYVRNLNTPQELGYTPQEPVFDKTKRSEFTAVEISVIAE